MFVYMIMLLNSIVLLVESLVANDAIVKMCKWLDDDAESAACIESLYKLKIVSVTVPKYSLDPAQYVVSILGRAYGDFKYQSERDRYVEEIERVANPLMERIELYFSDLGFEDSYIGMSVVANDDSYFNSMVLQFKFDLLKESDMLEDSELFQTLEDFGNNNVARSNVGICNIFGKAVQNKAELHNVSATPILVKGKKVFRVELYVHVNGNNKLGDLSPMNMNIPSDIRGGFVVGSGALDVVEAIWDKHCDIDLKGLKYTTTTTIKGGNAWIKFDYDANKVFQHISKKYGR